MSDLISRSALLDDFRQRQNLDCSDGEFCDCFLNNAQEVSTEWWCVEDAVESAPAINVVEVVHCEECVHRGKTYECPMRKIVYPLEGSGHLVDFSMDGGFCHCGKRKGEV